MLLLNQLIKYSGAAGFVALLVAFYTGVAEADFRFHKLSALLGVAFMCVHGGLIWYRGWKIKKQSGARQSQSAPAERG
ncbi:MAG TPA: hypothetical protein PLL10_11305, partial [Elusimicrobiales bacterium]|nr:hypothetical protein [Elusimicrobiales bacterium]